MKDTCHFILLWLLFMAAAGMLQAQEHALSYTELGAKADSCFMVKDFKRANEVFALILQKEECKATDWNNGACVAALCGEKETAFDRLDTLLKRYKNWYSTNFATQSDFEALHSDKRWPALCQEVEQRRTRIEKHFDKALIAQLQDLLRNDQTVRWQYMNASRQNRTTEADSLMKVMQKVDAENQIQLFKLIDEKGWASRKQVGNATHVYFVILQHSGLDHQLKYAAQVKKACKHGDISKGEYALYEDRINMFQHKPQRYGSQLEKQADGSYTLYTLADAQKVDRWRKEAGLPPLDDYLKSMHAKR